MEPILNLVGKSLGSALFDKLKTQWDIWKGELKDKEFEIFYKTLVTSFIRTQKGLDQAQAKKFFGNTVTYDGVLFYLYFFTNPDTTIREKCQEELYRRALNFKITNDRRFTTQKIIKSFLKKLDYELRNSSNKTLLPHFADIRRDIQEVKEEIKTAVGDSEVKIIDKIDQVEKNLKEQIDKFTEEQKVREERATQIDDSGEKLTVNNQPVYDSTAKVQPETARPVIRCQLEAIDEKEHRYRTIISDATGEELLKNDFTLKPDDAYLLQANHFLENDGLKDYRSQITLDSDLTFIQRLGNYFYELIMGKTEPLSEVLSSNGALKNGCQFLLMLDPNAELLWQAPWEYLHDGKEFINLSGKAALVRTPQEETALAASEIPQPLKILVVVSNPTDAGEFDSERALSAIHEALDYSRRQGWVELDFLEVAVYENLLSRLQTFQPQVVHYIGHGGKNPAETEAIKPPYSGKLGETFLAFEDDSGDLAPLYGKDLKQLLAGCPSVKLLVLSGCMTGKTALTDALSGVGTALLREQLPALVVMQYSVLVDTAIQFAKIFYEAIGRGAGVSRALTEVRQVLAKSRGEHRADWGIPALYLRTPQLKLIDPAAPKRNVEISGDRVNIGDLPLVAGFVGRQRELRQLQKTLRHTNQPVIYIRGLGGIGKTSLTAKLIEKLEQQNAIDGRLVIRCDRIEPTFAAMAQKLGSFISLQGKSGHAEAGLALQDGRHDIDTRISFLNNAIKEQRYLIVFDNFESFFCEKTPQVGKLADPALVEFFHALFSQNWQSTFLFTCRYQWNLLQEEKGLGRYKGGLPKENALLLNLEGLSAAQTRMLMKNLPALGQLSFSQQNQVIPLLLGHPYTIHLFDAYLKQHKLKAVLADEEITRRSHQHIFEQLGEYFLDGLWEQLTAAEKETLALLAIFRSALSEAALQQLAPDVQARQSLLNYSLLQRQSEQEGTEMAYQVHPVVRGYVENKMNKETLRHYHLQAVNFCTAQEAQKVAKLYQLPESHKQWTPRLLAQVARMLAQQGHTQPALALTESLLEMHHHLFAAGEFEQADGLVNALWLFLNMIGRREAAKALLRQSIASLEGYKKYLAKDNLATLLSEEGKWQEALTTYQESIDYYESIDAKQNIAVGLSQQAQIYQDRGEYERALTLERRALKIFEDLEAENSIVIQYYRTAQLLFLMERYEEALTAGEETLVKARAIGNAQYQAACLHQLGVTLNNLNRPQEAFARFQEGLNIYEKTGGNRAGQADTFLESGKLLRDSGQYEVAIQFFQRSIDIYMELQDPVKVAIALETIGVAFEQKSHFAEALEKYQEALRLAKKYSSPQHIATVENHIARMQAKIAGR